MVRLKVIRIVGFKQRFAVISIPYGSIKSCLHIAIADAHLVISIPYGSIKRITLKTYKAYCKISIPYGSIKSFFRDHDTSQCFVFQFLMVRLKGSPRRAGPARPQLFQFLMVRLKAISFPSAAPLYSHFNSLWFD